MTFRDQIYLLSLAQLTDSISGDTSQDTLNVMYTVASDLADAVANSVHHELIDKIDALGQAVSSLNTALAGVVPVPGDGGATLKVAASAVIPIVQLAVTELADAVEGYKT